MTDIFMDTSGWAELVDPKLPYHSLAAQIYYQTRQRKAKIVTTNYVIAEVVALLTSPLRFPRPRIIQFIEGLKASPLVKIVYLAQDLKVSPSKITQLIQETQSLTAELALRLGRYFDISPRFWLNLQNHYDLDVTEDALASRLWQEVSPRRVA